MTSTFGLLSTAYSALTAARAGTDVVGQNIANAATDGYVRQRVDISSVGAVRSGMLDQAVRAGQGVVVNGVARLADPLLDARVQTTSSTNGYWTVQAGALSTLETSLHEPGSSGTSAALSSFWTAWQTMSSNPGSAPSAGVLLQAAGQVSATIASGVAGGRRSSFATATAGTSSASSASSAASAPRRSRRDIVANQREAVSTAKVSPTGSPVHAV